MSDPAVKLADVFEGIFGSDVPVGIVLRRERDRADRVAQDLAAYISTWPRR